MASLPKLRPFSPSVRNDFNNPRRFPDNQGRQAPSSDPNNQYRDPLLSSYLGKGARLASIDSYHDYPEDNDSLSDHTLLPSDTRCPLIAEDDGEFLSDTPPAILEVAPSIQCPYPSNLASTPPRAATEEDAPNIEEMEKPGAPKPSENFVHSEVIASPSRSLDKFPSSPSHGFPYDDRANTMSTVCSSQQPPAYSVADTSKISSRDPETMSPFHRFRSAAVGVHAAVRLTRMQRLTKKAKWASKVRRRTFTMKLIAERTSAKKEKTHIPYCFCFVLFWVLFIFCMENTPFNMHGPLALFAFYDFL